MFHPSKMVVEDVGDRLMSFFNDLGTENREEQLRKEIREARYLLKSLKDQEKTLKDSFTQPESDVFNAPSKNHDQENILRRENEVLKLCHGVQLIINNTSTEAKLIFTPTCRGIFYGPFNIVFTMKESDFSIKSYQLLKERSVDYQTTVQVMKSIMKKRYHKEFSKKPYSIVPLNMLAEKFLQPEKCNLWQFSKSVLSYLTAYISRLVQIKKLQEDFGSDCTHLEFNDKISRLAFTLNINDYGEDNAKESSPGFKVCITLKYDLAYDLPKPGSLGLVVQNDAVVSLGTDGVDELKKQAEILYTKPLSEAILDGF